jgi:hypothetical protein
MWIEKFVRLGPTRGLQIMNVNADDVLDLASLALVFLTCLGCGVVELFANEPAEALVKKGTVLEVDAPASPYR